MVVRLAALCLLELAVVVWLAVQVFAAPPPAPPPAAAGPQAPVSSPGVAAQASAGSPDAATAADAAPSPKAAGPVRREVVPRYDPADPVGILLTGTVRWRDGGGVAGASIHASRGKERAGGSSGPDGGYAIVGLAPGEWTLRLRADGGKDVETTLTLGEDAIQQHDVTLDRSFPLRVRIVTPAGEDATTAMRKATSFGFGDFGVAGQSAPFPDRLAPTDYGMVFVGDANWEPERNPKDGNAGTLHLASAPPAHIALLQRHLVLQQQVVQPGQLEVTFVVDVDAVRALAASATVRVLDAETGAPIEGARVSMTTSNRGGIGTPTGADGRIVLENLSPGLLRCQIAAKDRETMYTTVRVEPRQRLDLGDVRLGPALPLRGMVVDEAGKPVGGASLAWAEHKWLGRERPFASNRGATTEADGTFQLWGTGRGTITVMASDSGGRHARGVFDNPPAEPIVLRLAATASCTVTSTRDPTRVFDLVLFDAGKRPVGGMAIDSRVAQRTMSMPPGDYAYELRENGRMVRTGTLRFSIDRPETLEVR